MLTGLMITGVVLLGLGLLAAAAAPKGGGDSVFDDDTVQPWTAWLMATGLGVFAVAGIATWLSGRGLSEGIALLLVCAGVAVLAGWVLGVHWLTRRRS